MRFHGLDLNLLVALDALLTHRNVTRAAEQLNLSQSALSGALARLREHFDDDLVVQIGRRMEPTPLARTLAEPLHDILLKTKSLVTATPTFDPHTSNRRISLIASDYSTEVLILDLLTEIAQQAPGIKVTLEEHTTETFERFNRGEINLRIIPKPFAFEGHPHERLFDDHYVCVAWRENGEIGDMLTLEQYRGLPHVVRFSRGALQTTFEQQVLDQAGFSRNVSVSVPLFTLVPRLVVGTRRIATVHARLAELYARKLPIRILAPPVTFPTLTEVLEWHYHEEDDPCLAWFRKTIVKHAASTFGVAKSLADTATGEPLQKLRATRGGNTLPASRSGRLVDQAPAHSEDIAD
jgi:LysR family transcriptional regulator, nod-box dependent transcriptional activator